MNYWTHQLNPILYQNSDWVITWYWFFYLLGGLWATWSLEKISHLTKSEVSQIMLYSWPCLFIGARFIFVTIYHPQYYWQHPLEIFAFWKGGMSFHGGLIGVIVALVWRSKRVENFWKYADAITLITPPILGLGRIGNFINGELAGRPTDVPWAVIFPRYDLIPRHPSQIYQALGEGPFLWGILLLTRKRNFFVGKTSAQFLIFYGLIRFSLEFFRLPDPQLGTFWHLSMGQYLCLVMIASGSFIYRQKSPPLPFNPAV